MFWFILNTICLYVSNPRNDFTTNHKRGGAFRFGCAVVPYLPLKLDMFYTPPATRVHCLTPEPHLVSLSWRTSQGWAPPPAWLTTSSRVPTGCTHPPQELDHEDQIAQELDHHDWPRQELEQLRPASLSPPHLLVGSQPHLRPKLEDGKSVPSWRSNSFLWRLVYKKGQKLDSVSVLVQVEIGSKREGYLHIGLTGFRSWGYWSDLYWDRTKLRSCWDVY
jgi:hypothetical protein